MNKLLVSVLWLGITLYLPLLYSCDSQRILEEHQGVKDQSWAIDDTVSFHINGKEESPVITTLHIKYNEDYDYHNLYVRYFLKDSLGNILENELLDMLLFDPKSGKPLGKGFGNSYTRTDTLPLIQLSQKSTYKVQFVQYMRNEDLNGIEAVGLKIIKEE